MPIATKNNAIIVKDGKVAENCGCCATEWVCVECDACPLPDAIRINISALTPPIYNNCVCGVFLPGETEPTPRIAFAYYIKLPSGSFTLTRVGGDAFLGMYQYGDLTADVTAQATVSYGTTSPQTAIARFDLNFRNFIRYRNAQGGTPPSQEEMASDDWGDSCATGTGENLVWFPPDVGELVFTVRAVHMPECGIRGDVAIRVEQECSNGTESRMLKRVPGSGSLISASTATGCAPPVSMTIQSQARLLGWASSTSGSAIVTNVQSVYDFGLWGGATPLWLISTSVPSAPWPTPEGHIPTEVYGTPTVQHTLQATIDSIDMMYGANAVPMFANRGKPACSI